MKFSKQIAVTVLLAISVVCAVLYTSCSKSACKGVTCINYGTCSGGMCTCPAGTGGNNCQTVYRTLDSGVYVGIGAKDTGSIHADSAILVFSPTNDTIFTNMHLSVTDSSNNIFLTNAGITLIYTSSSGSTFTVIPQSYDTFTISGSGSVNGSTASLNLTLRDQTDTLYRTVSYSGFNKEY